MEGKRTIQQANQVLIEVIELLLNSYSRKQIVQYISETHKISERQVDNYLAKAYTELSEKKEEYKDKIFKQSIQRLNSLYEKNMSVDDYRECRQVQESIIKLFGIDAPQKIDHTTQGEKIQAITGMVIK